MHQFQKLGLGIVEGHHSSYRTTPELCPKSCLGRAWAPLQSWDTKMRGQGALNLALLSNVGREEPSHTPARGENVDSKTRPQGWFMAAPAQQGTVVKLLYSQFPHLEYGTNTHLGVVLRMKWSNLCLDVLIRSLFLLQTNQEVITGQRDAMWWDGMGWVVYNMQVTLQVRLHHLRAISQRRCSINYQQNTCSQWGWPQLVKELEGEVGGAHGICHCSLCCIRKQKPVSRKSHGSPVVGTLRLHCQARGSIPDPELRSHKPCGVAKKKAASTYFSWSWPQKSYGTSVFSSAFSCCSCVVAVQSLSHVWLFVTPLTAAC